ncbi:MAG: fructose PTS transporter subunit IIA [Mycoplasma sp.]
MKDNIKIFLNTEVANLDELFDFLSEQAKENGVVDKVEHFKKALLEREKIGSTGLENNIAIPHAISDDNQKSFIFVVRLKNSIEWKTLDDKDVKVAICLAVPKANQTDHLVFLQKISIMLLNKEKQDLLKVGTLAQIKKMFNEIDFEGAGATKVVKETIKKTTVTKEVEVEKEEEKLINLINVRRELKHKIKDGDNSVAFDLIKLNDEIKEVRVTISKLRTELSEKKSSMKEEFEAKKKELNTKITSLKESTKLKINLVKVEQKSKKEIFIAENSEKENFQKELNQLNFQNYKELSEATKELEDTKIEKIEYISDYKKNSEEVVKTYQEILTNKRYLITNERNVLYKHSNKLQLCLMLALVVIGLWAVVLGGLGMGTPESLMPRIDEWAGLGIVGVDVEKIKLWASTPIAPNHGLAISSLVIGILSIVSLIPLKMFKVSNVMKENHALATVAISVCLLIAVSVIAIMSFENIDAYTAVTKTATQLNAPFHSAIILSQPLKTEADFATAEQWSSYQWNMGSELQKWLGGEVKDIELSEANRATALAKATAKAKEVYDSVFGASTMSFDINALSCVVNCGVLYGK